MGLVGWRATTDADAKPATSDAALSTDEERLARAYADAVAMVDAQLRAEGDDAAAAPADARAARLTRAAKLLAALRARERADADRAAGAARSGARARVLVARWHVVTLVVDADAGALAAFVDGALALALDGLEPAELRLQHRLTVFGGGNQAQARGGGVRALVLHAAEAPLLPPAGARGDGDDRFGAAREFAREVALWACRDNAELVWCATKVQALGRGGVTRRKERERKAAEAAARAADRAREEAEDAAAKAKAEAAEAAAEAVRKAAEEAKAAKEEE